MEHQNLEAKIAALEQKIDKLTRMMVWARRWGTIRILIFYVLPVVLLAIYAVPLIKTVQQRIEPFVNIMQRPPPTQPNGDTLTSALIQQYLRGSGISVDGLCRELCPTK